MRKILPTLLEVVFAAAFVGGVALISVPAALMVGGVLGIFAVERGAK